jgi:hypothetical protein
MAEGLMKSVFRMLSKAKVMSQLTSREVGPNEVTYLGLALDKRQLELVYIFVSVFAELFPENQVDEARLALSEQRRDVTKNNLTVAAVITKLKSKCNANALKSS